MATKKMLIDTAHPEETRVVVMSGNRIEDFEVEAADRKQLKGNIYLAKVTRVEPSLQAAFVEYGGNRHGFLAFSEIHPDYYQIPVADREALMAEQNAADRAAAAADEAQDEAASASASKGRRRKAEAASEPAEDGENEGNVDVIAGDEGEEVEVRRPSQATRNYKIQEVIKRRQIMLVQVVKEERGTKGAALTTYLSLAGRYCVLMPNTGRGGGISRKIASGADRTRLKAILGELDIPEGMAVIVRTAGAKRNKTEIKRDCNYLLRLWESVRELTLQSIAPALVYEEANLIKRTIRDLYSSDIDEIIVDGELGFQTAKAFIKLLMPSHIKRVKQHPAEDVPLFQLHGVETQLQGIFKPDVPLKSGGYIVINPTEALVSIDVNSGRATRERNIEETALRTNLEASDEVARQVRLREMAGLIVIDYIDMEHSRNQIQVERRLKTAMRNDRARIQIGRISAFGLMELSRQRLHPSLLETCFEPFPHAAGVGYRRTVASSALAALRAIEEEGAKGLASEILVQLPTAVTVYIANYKRATLSTIEARHEMIVRFAADDTLAAPDLRIERIVTRAEPRPPILVRTATESPAEAADDEVTDDETNDLEAGGAESTEERSAPEDAGDRPVREDGQESTADGAKRRRRRRSRRRRGGNGERDGIAAHPHQDSADGDRHSGEDAAEAIGENRGEPTNVGEPTPATAEAPREGQEDGDEQERARRRRRGRRGGRRRPRDGAEALPPATDLQHADQPDYYQPAATDAESAGMPVDVNAAGSGDMENERVEGAEAPSGTSEDERPARRRRSRRPRAQGPRDTSETAVTDTDVAGSASEASHNAPPLPLLPPGPRPYWASRPPVTNEAETPIPAATQPEPAVEADIPVAAAPATEPAVKTAAEPVAHKDNGAEPESPPTIPDPNVIVVDRIDPGQSTRRGWWKRLTQS